MIQVHDDAPVALQQKGDAAFARLAVDAHDAVIGAAQVLWVHRQIGHAPGGIAFLRGKALGDRILVRAREGGEHQIAHIGVARVNRQSRAFLGNARHGGNV